ncbi:hypothetical protein GMA11_08995 [Granulicatella sp. zg-ZJ]|uniref:hypothetical protein n=1 Tax=Granulicatella sp. zg-ZJ TaxID=2678504 RepID=UPI0013D77324|nr:hypothetical protein [Granulicatella sp. zg-ZJ]NEW63504.1 hypothetical protein [Granulicatella sp. zg-ZJ]
MRKNLKKLVVLGLVGVSFGGAIVPTVSNGVAYAENVSKQIYTLRNLSEYEVKLIDKYVFIKNDRFYLKSNDKLSDELKYLAEQYIQKANKSLDEYEGHVFIDYSSKKIMGLSLLSRAPGKNGLEFHWNYVRVFVDAGALNIILQGGLAGGLSMLASKFSLNNHLGSAIGAMIGQAAQQNDGIWFDYNYFVGMLTFSWGVQ